MVIVLSCALKHGLTEEEITYAWQCPVRCRQRLDKAEPTKWMAIGSTSSGKFVELIAFQDAGGRWIIYHAMTPPTKKFIRELGMERN